MLLIALFKNTLQLLEVKPITRQLLNQPYLLLPPGLIPETERVETEVSLEHNQSEGPDISDEGVLVVLVFGLEDLRGHVGLGADVSGSSGVFVCGDTEVGEFVRVFAVRVVHDDVMGFYVSVDDSDFVDSLEGEEDALDEGECLLGVEGHVEEFLVVGQ